MFQKIALISLAAIMALGTVNVDAKRIGGGKSTGAKRDVATQRQSAPPAAAPAAGATAATAAPGAAAVAAKPAAAAAAPAAAAAAPKTGFSRFLPMLGGLALGAALASMFGGGAIGSMIANILMFAAVGLVALFAFRWFMARKNGGNATPAFAGAGASAAASPFGGATQRTSAEPIQFGSNRPAEAPQLLNTPVAVPPAAMDVKPDVPAGFDVPGFEKGAKSQFIRLQAAFDKGEADTLKDMLTDEMHAEVERELKERGAQTHPTEIVTLNAEVIEVTSETDGHWASVRFHGMLREDGKDLPEAFDEVWNMVKPIDGSAGWMLAGIQQLV